MNITLKKELIPYEQAFDLKKLKFDKICFSAYRNTDGEESLMGLSKWTNTGKENTHDGYCVAPTYAQAFSWFRDKHQLYHEIQIDQTTEPKFCFTIAKFIGNPKDLTEKEWYWDNIPNDDTWGLYITYEEAELACLKKLR